MHGQSRSAEPDLRDAYRDRARLPSFRTKRLERVSSMRDLLMMAILSSCLAVLACNRDGETDDRSLSFLDRSQPVATRTSEDLTRSIEPVQVEVFEPHQRMKMTFEALPLQQVLDDVYGRIWREREAIVFTCRDGYESTIAVRRILSHSAFLALSRLGQKEFTIVDARHGAPMEVSLGPFYVIWENLDDAKIRAEDDYGWPYQVVGIELVSFDQRFGRMVPDREASKRIWAGFDAFTIHCSRCHAINGQGGSVGPELNYPANPTEYMNKGWLRRWIDDPTSMRRDPAMPPLNRNLPERDRVIEDIVQYLEAIALRKIEPSR